jgi:hypothetical protein
MARPKEFINTNTVKLTVYAQSQLEGAVYESLKKKNNQKYATFLELFPTLFRKVSHTHTWHMKLHFNH